MAIETGCWSRADIMAASDCFTSTHEEGVEPFTTVQLEEEQVETEPPLEVYG